MPDEFQYDVFLSHCSQDKAVVRDVAERLGSDGLKVWLEHAPIKGSLAQFLCISGLPADHEQEYAEMHETQRWPATLPLNRLSESEPFGKVHLCHSTSTNTCR